MGFVGVGLAFDEAHGVVDEAEVDVVRGAVTVFGEDEEGLAFFGGFFFFVFDFHFATGVVGTGEEANHVGVLLDGTGFTEVGENGALAFALFDGTVELGEDDDGDVEFFGEAFEAGGDFGDFDLAVVFGAP